MKLIDKKTTLAAFSRSLQRESHVLKEHPNLLWQQFYNRLQWEGKPVMRLLEPEFKRRNAPGASPWIKKSTRFRESESLIRTLSGSSDWATSCAITPSGDHIISGHSDGNLIVWDVKSGTVLRILSRNSSIVHAVAVTPDGNRIISSSEENILVFDDMPSGEVQHLLMVWDLNTGYLLKKLAGHKDRINAIAVTLDGGCAISGSADKTIKVWDLENYIELNTMEGHTDEVISVAVNPDMTCIISASDCETKVWEFDTGNVVSSLDDTDIIAVAVTPDGRSIFSAGYLDTKVLDLQSIEEHRVLGEYEELLINNAVSVTPDNRSAISISENNNLKMWDLETGKMLLILEGHMDEITSVTVTPDGKHAFTTSKDTSIKEWDLGSEFDLRALDFHTDEVNVVVVTPDGTKVISGSNDTIIKIWDLMSSRLIYNLEGHKSIVKALAVNQDGTRVISGSTDIRVWDIDSGAELYCLKWGNGNALAVTPDGTRAIAPSNLSLEEKYSIRVWDLESGNTLINFKGHTEGVDTLKITPDGMRVVSAGSKRTIVWDIASGEEIHTINSGCKDLVVTPDGTHVILYPSVKVCDLNSGEILYKIGKQPSFDNNHIRLNPDGTQAIFSSYKSLNILDLDIEKLIFTIDGHSIESLTITSDGQHAIFGSGDNTLRVWNLKTRSEEAIIYGVGRIKTCVVAPDGKTIVAGDRSGHVHIMELLNLTHGPTIVTARSQRSGILNIQCPFCMSVCEIKQSNLGSEIFCPDCGATLQVNPFTGSNGKRLNSGSLDEITREYDLQSSDVLRTMKSHKNVVAAVAVTPNGTNAISASWDNTLGIWDLKRGIELRTLFGHTKPVLNVAVTSDGRLVISADQNKTTRVWDLESGKHLRTLENYTSPVALTPDGQQAISGAGNNTLKVWDLESGEEQHTLEKHRGYIYAIAVNPNGQQVVSSSRDKTIKLWDLQSGKLLNSLEGHTSDVYTVTISPDGQSIISGASDKTLRVWDLQTGKAQQVLRGHTSAVMAVVVMPDGKNLISGSIDKTIRIWDLESGAEVAILRGFRAIEAVAVTRDGMTLVIGDRGNQIHFLQLNMISHGAPIITARHKYNGILTIDCPHCTVPSEIEQINLGSEIPCPECESALRVNLFVVENSRIG
jgi:WD40 repeat protein